MELQMLKIDWRLDLGPTLICSEYEKKLVENSGLECAQKKIPFGPLVATNRITERPKSIGT